MCMLILQLCFQTICIIWRLSDNFDKTVTEIINIASSNEYNGSDHKQVLSYACHYFCCGWVKGYQGSKLYLSNFLVYIIY